MQSLHILLAGLLIPLLSSCGAQGSHPQDPTASQLEGQGAGNTTVNGHYSVNGSIYGHPLFVKTGSVEQLYFYDGYWRFGVAGEVVLYVACYESATPFVQFCGSGSGWGVSPPPTILIPTPAVGDLTFEDNFSDPVLNRSKWNVLEQVHRGGVYTAENVYVENGQLVLRTIAQNITPADDRMAEMFYESSGAVNTSNLFSQRYGKWEARVKLPDVDATPGYTLHSSFWLFSGGQKVPPCSGCNQEIDIVEQYADPSRQHHLSAAAGNIHPFKGGRLPNGTMQPCTKVPRSGAIYEITKDFTSDWHTFTLYWTPTVVLMLVDGKQTVAYTSEDVLMVMTDPLYTVLSACIMDRLPPTTADHLPQFYYIDYVRTWNLKTSS